MSTTSQKHRNFVSEPMGDKPVTELAGVGAVLGTRLQQAGYVRATAVLGKFLALDKDQERFKTWMKIICNANTKQANDCYQCLNEWCELFL